MTNITAINAPYNFVPLSDQVITPAWGKQVSHDLPFKDGLSGEIPLNISTCSAIMVGGERSEANKDQAGEVYFFRNKEGHYSISGSSLRGVIRSTMEIATFSRMDQVDDIRYGLRDISGEYVKDSYAKKVRNKIEYGFLKLDAQGQAEITPCSMVRLSHRDLEHWWHEKDIPIFTQGMTVKEKYQKWETLCKKHQLKSSTHFSFISNSHYVDTIGSGDLHGYPVFTGQITAENAKYSKFNTHYKGRPKYKDFVFYNPQADKRFLLEEKDPSAWRSFLFIHDDKDNSNLPWTGYWKAKFWNKQRVPVFYIRSGKRLQMGLAYMPKLAGDYSTHDMIKHTNDAHLSTDKMDFTSLVFGQVGDKPEEALKGRVYFEPAFIQGKQQEESHPKATILNGAKPSYFPNYLKQSLDGNGNLEGNQYHTYLSSSNSPLHKTELRGWKRYPVRPDNEVSIQTITSEQISNTKVQTKLHCLPKGCHFKSRLVFHNLKPEELGALLWSLEMDGHRHSIGMAKSFGYGQVKIHIDWQEQQIKANNRNNTVQTPAQYIACFQNYMKQQLKRDWHKTPQIKNLQAMTDIEQRDLFKAKLEHMKMSMKGSNEFLHAKQAGWALASYIDASGGDCAWVTEAIEQVKKQHNISTQNAIRSKPLAEKWDNITDLELKQEALLEIQRLWSKHNVWEKPPNKAKIIYQKWENFKP